jgi:hypothetical protein
MVRDGSNPLPLWLPDVHFSDAIGFEVYAEVILNVPYDSCRHNIMTSLFPDNSREAE